MSVVADASFLVAAVADSGPQGRWAEKIVAAEPLVGPHLVLVEAANILRRLQASGEIEPAEATEAHQSLLRLDLELVPYRPFAARVWELRAKLTAYDAWYVAAAEAFDLPFATLDGRLSRASGPTCRFLLPAADAG